MSGRQRPQQGQDSYTIGVFLSIPIVDKYIAEYQKRSRNKIFTSAANFDEALEQARLWEQQGVDVFISRRGTGDLLRKNFLTPVLTLPVSEMEVMHCLRSSCPKNSSVLIPIFAKAYTGFTELQDVIDIRILHGVYNNFAELDALVRQSREQGVDFVAGGGATQRLASAYNIPFISLAPSQEQFLSILESAGNVATFHREKASMVREMQSIMDAMVDGFLSVDVKGNIVACNTVALALLKENDPKNIIGTSIFAHMSRSDFHDLFQATHEHHERVVDIGGTQLVLHASVMKRQNTIEKVLISLREVHDVLRQSGSIRSVMSRGFETHYRLSDMVHKSEAIKSIVELCRLYAKTNSSVLICGETGTGKEILSQGMHNSSRRRKKPFVSINCAELPEHLLESELFGYDEGAFTGSRKGGKAGFFELAHGGTLLLDEIDSASALVQGKLLRVLQEKEIMRIGGKRKIPVDVRVLATSGQDLWDGVCRGFFRKDLFFRLNVMSIYIPPLRERLEDIDALLPYFLHYFAQRENLLTPTLQSDQMRLIRNYSWPGNVRQLQHFAERFVLYASFMEKPFPHLYNDLLRLSHMQHSLPQAHGESRVVEHSFKPSPHAFSVEGHAGVQEPDLPPSAKYPLGEPERIREALVQARYSKKEAAHLLGISRSTLWRKMSQYNML